MIRIIAMLLLALSASAPAQAAQRSFTVISFDRIRVEAPFDVSLATGRAPMARAEGALEALDTVDLKVEGRILIVRQRSGWNGSGRGSPVRISLGTPDLRTATLVGSGRLVVDRMRGLTVTLGLAGPGQLKVADVAADQVDLTAAGSGMVELAGTAKKARLGAEGTVVLDAAALRTDDLDIRATGNAEVRASARRNANLLASGAAIVSLKDPVACTRKVTGAASISNCR